MPPMREIAPANLDLAQAAELAALVELEARWENLRKPPSRTSEVPSTTQELHGRQKTYEAFRAGLAAYNQRYRPAHIPELLLNTPARLGLWCRGDARPVPPGRARPRRGPPGPAPGEGLPAGRPGG